MFTIETRTKLGEGWPVKEITIDDGLKLIIEDGHLTVLWTDKPVGPNNPFEHYALHVVRDAGQNGS